MLPLPRAHSLDTLIAMNWPSDDATLMTNASKLYIFKSCISHTCTW